MRLVFTAILVMSLSAFAEDKKSFNGSSEASAVVISGNTNSETYSAKTKDTYDLTEKDLLTFSGKYLQSASGGTETAHAWDAALRYDRVLVQDEFTVFVQQKAEHDPYNGVFVQRDSSDVGGKYQFVKTDNISWFGELGYRYSDTYITSGVAREQANFLRLYSEVGYKISDTSSAKFWVEHLPNLSYPDQYQTNAEASLSATMTTVFSLKFAYLINHNEAIAAPGKKDTTTLTTALVATY